MTSSPGGDGPVGFVGVGAMGYWLVRRLLGSGTHVVVTDRRAEAVAGAVQHGAQGRVRAKDVADTARSIFMSLPTPEVVRSVVLGSDGLVEGQRVETVVDLSTTGPAVAEEVAAALAEVGVSYVDAPVSGGTGGARNGSLAVMAAGREEVIAGIRPFLEAFGTVFVVGDRPGQGQVAKLANNLLSATAIFATGEAVALGVKAGIDPGVLLDVFNAGTGRNSATADKFPRAVLSGTFDIGFRLSLMAKDLRLCAAEAQRQQTPMVIGDLMASLWTLAEKQGSADDDSMSMVKMLERWSGTHFGPGARP